MRNIIPIIFYGNLFYGLCAIVLCLETNFQHHLPPNGLHFYLLVFTATVIYYSRVYYKSISYKSTDKRIIFYRDNQRVIKVFLTVALLFVALDSLYLLIKLDKSFIALPAIQYGIMVIFPLVAFLYTYKIIPIASLPQLRGIGWLKPFFIGFAWSGLVTVYPVFFRQMQSGSSPGQLILPSALFWLQNFLFISALAIMFDIRDHLPDARHHLKTYPAILGVRKTIWLIIFPLVLLSVAVLLLHQKQQHAAPLQIAIQLIPFLLLFIVTMLLHKDRDILFYLVAIDGLMLLKGVCGIISCSFF